MMPTVPPILKFLIESKDITASDLQYCHTVGCGAAPVSKNSVQKFQEKVGDHIRFVEGSHQSLNLYAYIDGYCDSNSNN